MEAVEARKPKNHLEKQLILLVNMATDKGGKPLFEMGDIHHLKKNCDFVVLQRVFGFMLSPFIDQEEADKEVAENPTSATASH